ncbi:MAG TPA: CPBP family intramembrane glutamic endopeptidase [Terracidiphilus sp.]|jgi:membrane protease YdiL (CAAX protease family)|nr:CPBP family intramembrane glutamic endopeptidase [Terracidiphilus sp.]
MTTASSGGRIRAYLEFVVAVLFFFLARSVARQVAADFAGDFFGPVAEQAAFLLFLILGFAGFGALFDRQKNPISGQGLPLRAGWTGEAGIGLAVGWGTAVACVVPLTLIGGIAIVLTTGHAAWIWLLIDMLFFALMAMAEEVAFRGYGMQRFAVVVGPIGASLGYAAFYGVVQALLPGANRLSVVVAVIFSLVLSTAYWRTKALWVSWGLNFGWKASRALVFGLAVSGVTNHSPVVEGDPMGPFWLTGGGFGVDGSWTALVVLLLAWMVVYRATSELDFRYNAPVLVPSGIPVDLDAAARRQHEAAMGAAEPATPGLVQILPVAAPVASKPEETTSAAAPERLPGSIS